MVIAPGIRVRKGEKTTDQHVKIRLMSLSRATLFVCLLTVPFLGGCDLPFGTEFGDGTPPPEVKDRIVVRPGLEVALLAPDTVATTDSFDVRVRLENTAGRLVRVTTPSSCLVRPGVFSGDDRVEWNGSLIGCAMVITERALQPGAPQTKTFEMQAVTTSADGEVPASPGEYTVRIQIDWTVEGREAERVLSAPLRVVEEE